jgi:hypothetical protein
MIPRTPTTDEDLVDRIFAAAGLEHDQQLEVKWTAAVTLAAHVLGRLDDVARERKLRGLTDEVREALTSIKKIMRGELQ